MLIQHARPRLKPPGYAVLRVRRDHPLAVGLVGCFVQGGQYGLGRDLVTGQAFAGTNTPSTNLTPEGPAVDYSGTALTSATSQPIWNVLGEITVAWRGIIRTPHTNGFIFGKVPTGGNGGVDTPFSLEYANPWASHTTFVRSNTGAMPFRVWQSGNAFLTANALASIAVSQGADISLAPSFYNDGELDPNAPNSQYNGAGAGSPTGNTSPVQFGRRPDGAGQHAGQTTIALLAARQWSAKEHQRFAWAPYEVLEEAPVYHFLSFPAASPIAAESHITYSMAAQAAGAVAVAGDSAAAYALAGTTAGTLAVAGASDLSLALAGQTAGGVVLAGTSAVALAYAGVTEGAVLLAGDSAGLLALAGVTAGTVALAAASALSLSIAGTMVGVNPYIVTLPPGERHYSVTLQARSYSATLAARAYTVTLPPRSYS